MITIKPISTISYNSDSFLTHELEKLMREHLIEFYAFITHKPEEDETKEHKHLFVVPSRRLDTFDIVDKLKEPDPARPNNPLGCIQFKSSKFGDWYLYAIHDKDYLATKGETRKFHYTREEIVVSDNDYFLELIHTSDFTKFKIFAKFRDMVSSGVEFAELVRNGFIPIQQIYQYEKAYYKMKGCEDYETHTYRDGRKGHEEDDLKKAFDDFNERCLSRQLREGVQSTLDMETGEITDSVKFT